MFEAIAFYVFGAIVISLFWLVVTTNNILYAMVGLAGGMIFISAFFFLLHADFLGVVQIIVYCGAVMALYGFSTMLVDQNKIVRENIYNKKIIYFIVALSLIILCLNIYAGDVENNLENIDQSLLIPLEQGSISSIQMLGITLFQNYILVFEVTGILLLIAMIAGIALIKNDTIKNPQEEEK